jgi:hypothetical protein
MMSSSSRVTATTVVVGAVASVHARPCSYVEPLRPTVALAIHMADPDGRRDPRAVAAQRLAEERGSLLVLQVPPLADEALLDPPAGLPRWHGGGGLDNTLHFAEWACGAVESVLPPSVVQQLRDFSEGDGAPALLLRGLGVDGDLVARLCRRPLAATSSGASDPRPGYLALPRSSATSSRTLSTSCKAVTLVAWASATWCRSVRRTGRGGRRAARCLSTFTATDHSMILARSTTWGLSPAGAVPLRQALSLLQPRGCPRRLRDLPPRQPLAVRGDS